MGILADTVYEQKRFELEENAGITLYTDGVIEAKNGSGELFGIKKLLKTIESQPNKPDAIVKQITRSVDRFTETEGRSDDLTLLTFCTD